MSGRFDMVASVWKPEKITKLCELWADPRHSIDGIAVELGTTYWAVRQKASKLGLGPRPDRSRAGRVARHADPDEEAERDARARNILACRMHLADLERAGFSYAHGERLNPTGRSVPRAVSAFVPTFSPCGSPAAMCTE